MSDIDAAGLAWAYVEAGQWDRALAVLAPVIASTPTDARALCLVARCHLGLDDPATALTAANAAAAAAPDDEWAARLQSAALRGLGRTKDARAAADRAVRLAPTNPYTHVERATADVASRRMTRQGKASARQAVRLAPSDAAVHVTMGNVFVVQKQRRKANAAYREALRLDPNNASAQRNLAAVAASNRQVGTAARLLVGLLRLDPTSADYAATLQGLLSSMVVVAALFCGVAIAFVMPRGGGPQPGPGSYAAALLACLVSQGVLVWRLHAVSRGWSAIRFLRSAGGRRGGLLRTGVGVLVAVDLLVVVAVVAAALGASTAATVAAGTGLVLCFGAALLVLASAVHRPGADSA